MNPDVKQLWIKALTDGIYKQGQGSLRDLSDCYCSLGVLCDISKVGTWEKNLDESQISWTYSGMVKSLPQNVKDYAGIDDAAEAAIILINDGLRTESTDFDTIALWIEENL